MADAVKQRLGVTDIIGSKREDVLRIASRHKARNLRVFGSVARGEAHSNSDIDLLVDFEPDYKLLDQAALVVELSKLLGRKVDIAVASNLRDEYRQAILRDARPLLKIKPPTAATSSCVSSKSSAS